MTDLQTQIRGYAAQLDEDQAPVDAGEAMARRSAVQELPEPRRIGDGGGRRVPRWAFAVAALALVGSVAAVIVWLSGPSDVGPADSPTPTTIPTATTVPPAPTTTAAPPTTVATAPPEPVPTVVASSYVGGDGFDYATGVAAVAEGGYVVAIDYRSGGEGDLVMARYSSDDEVLWTTAWSTDRQDAPMRGAIDLDSSGAAYVGLALLDTSIGDHDAAVLKFDAAGDLVWQRAAAGVPGGQRTHVVVAGEDGSVFAGGHHDFGVAGTPENVFLARFDPDGELMWQQALVGDANVSATAFGGALDPSGNLIISGIVGDHSAEVDALIAKIDPDGNIVWQRSWGLPGAPDRAWNVVTDPGGNVYASGPVFGVGDGGDQTFVVKLDADGELVWARIWTIPGNELWSSGTAFRDGTLVVSGFAGRVDADGIRMDKSPYYLGISADGELLWQAAIGARPQESAEALAFAADGSLISVGQGAVLISSGEGEGPEPNIVSLDGEWLASDIPLTTTGLIVVELDMPWGEGSGTVSTGPAAGGGSGADALVMRLELP